MAMLRVLLALLVLGTAAAAQDGYPRLHDVVGVASDDVLNLRAGPGAGHDKVGELTFDARAVEVVRAEGGWGLVNAGEGPGWASLRYLAPRADGDLPNVRRVTCGGDGTLLGRRGLCRAGCHDPDADDLRDRREVFRRPVPAGL